MTAKHEITLRITLTDEELIRKIRSISQPDRGRVIQRALKVYFESAGGREVCELFAKEKTSAIPDEKIKKAPRGNSSGRLKDILGEY